MKQASNHGSTFAMFLTLDKYNTSIYATNSFRFLWLLLLNISVLLGFSDGMVDIPIESTHSLDIVQRSLDGIPAGETDCSLPMFDAMDKKIKDIDVFVIYTDNETG
jgi:hypothetical protein